MPLNDSQTQHNRIHQLFEEQFFDVRTQSDANALEELKKQGWRICGAGPLEEVYTRIVGRHYILERSRSMPVSDINEQR